MTDTPFPSFQFLLRLKNTQLLPEDQSHARCAIKTAVFPPEPAAAPTSPSRQKPLYAPKSCAATKLVVGWLATKKGPVTGIVKERYCHLV